jgi:hypothetical protein
VKIGKSSQQELILGLERKEGRKVEMFMGLFNIAEASPAGPLRGLRRRFGMQKNVR